MCMYVSIYCGSIRRKGKQKEEVEFLQYALIILLLMETANWQNTVNTFDALWAHKVHGLVSWILYPWPGNAQLLHHTMQQPLDICF